MSAIMDNWVEIAQAQRVFFATLRKLGARIRSKKRVREDVKWLLDFHLHDYPKELLTELTETAYGVWVENREKRQAGRVSPGSSERDTMESSTQATATTRLTDWG